MPTLNIDEIEIDAGLQARDGLDQGTAEEYGAAFSSGAVLPPLVVFESGGRMFVTDGFHRLAGARIAGLKTIEAEVRHGGRRPALLHAIGSNHAHGKRRTAADKRRAVGLLLADEEWARWSDNAIAKCAGCSRDLVDSVRQELSCGTARYETTERQVTRGGQQYSMQTGNIGNGHSAEAVTPPLVESVAEVAAGTEGQDQRGMEFMDDLDVAWRRCIRLVDDVARSAGRERVGKAAQSCRNNLHTLGESLRELRRSL